MTNNDILRRLRYTFNFNDQKMISIFALADLKVSREQVSAWLKKDDDKSFVEISDVQMATFLNGFINDKRGKKEGPQPVPEKTLTKNIVLTKLKIALNLKAEDIVEILKLANFSIGKSELSAFFRKPDHKHYRSCKAQILRNFLTGLDAKFHVARPARYKTDATQAQPKKAKKQKPVDRVEGAKPNASKLYVNPNAKLASEDKTKPERKVLKLKSKS